MYKKYENELVLTSKLDADGNVIPANLGMQILAYFDDGEACPIADLYLSDGGNCCFSTIENYFQVFICTETRFKTFIKLLDEAEDYMAIKYSRN